MNRMVNRIEKFKDERGLLVPVVLEKINFIPKRIFYVYDVPNGVVRGNHAHRENKQLLICLNGRIEIKIDDGIIEDTIMLRQGQQYFHNRLEWANLRFHDDACLLSICSHEYDPDDYIHNYDEFIDMVEKSGSNTPRMIDKQIEWLEEIVEKKKK